MSSGNGKFQETWDRGWMILTMNGLVLASTAAAVVLVITSSGAPGYGWGVLGGLGASWRSMRLAAVLVLLIPPAVVILLVHVLARAAPPSPAVALTFSPDDSTTVLKVRYPWGELSRDALDQKLHGNRSAL